MPYKPPTIEEQGGIQVYLDRPDQRKLHRGFGYKMWYTARHVAKLNKTAVCKLFNITLETYNRYVEVEEHERNGKKEKEA
jgi:hypothetical protein